MLMEVESSIAKKRQKPKRESSNEIDFCPSPSSSSIALLDEPLSPALQKK